jgi:hypothetical protein
MPWGGIGKAMHICAIWGNSHDFAQSRLAGPQEKPLCYR